MPNSREKLHYPPVDTTMITSPTVSRYMQEAPSGDSEEIEDKKNSTYYIYPIAINQAKNTITHLILLSDRE